MRFFRYARFFLPVIPVGIFFWLFWIDATPLGVFVIEQRVEGASPFVGRLLPDDRVRFLEDEADGPVQELVDEPVYWHLQAPGNFDTLTVDIFFRTLEQSKFEMGLLKSLNPRTYVFRPLEPSDRWSSGRAVFDLKDAWKEDGDITLVLSAPGVEGDAQRVFIKSATFEFRRPPRSLSEIFGMDNSAYEKKFLQKF